MGLVLIGATMGSALGIGAAAKAAAGAWAKEAKAGKPLNFAYIILTGMPLSQTIYGFILMLVGLSPLVVGDTPLTSTHPKARARDWSLSSSPWASSRPSASSVSSSSSSSCQDNLEKKTGGCCVNYTAAPGKNLTQLQFWPFLIRYPTFPWRAQSMSSSVISTEVPKGQSGEIWLRIAISYRLSKNLTDKADMTTTHPFGIMLLCQAAKPITSTS